MPGKAWIALGAAVAMWLVYFYLVDMTLIEVQGLPVGWDLMPR